MVNRDEICGPMFYFSKVEHVGAETFCRFAWNDAFAIIVYYVAGIILFGVVPYIAIITLYPRIIYVCFETKAKSRIGCSKN